MTDTVKTEKQASAKLDAPLVASVYHERKYRNIRALLRGKKKKIWISEPSVSFGFEETIKKIRTKIIYQQKKTQGKILVRLVYRETNNSAFEHIREYKGAVSACFWQGIALLFGNNLKADYEPEGRDREIEEIVRKVDSERK